MQPAPLSDQERQLVDYLEARILFYERSAKQEGADRRASRLQAHEAALRAVIHQTVIDELKRVREVVVSRQVP